MKSMDKYYSFAKESAAFLYYSSLLACIPFAGFYKKIEDDDTKRFLGAGIGALISVCVCGPYAYFTLLMVIGNMATLPGSECDKDFGVFGHISNLTISSALINKPQELVVEISRIAHEHRVLSIYSFVHQISLFFTCSILLFIHFNVECTKYSTWLFQNLGLKLVGLAFELNIYDKNINSDGFNKSMPTDDRITRLSVADIVSYAYFFIGLHKGPYFTWRTYHDYLNSTSGIRGDFGRITEQKLKKALLLTVGYVVLRAKYPISIYSDDEFYTNYGTDYRFLLGMPQLVIYYLEYQIMLMLSTSACSEAGFGVYPSKSMAVPGAGPTVNYKPNEKKVDGEPEEYNFAMLKCFDNEKLIMGPKMKDTVRGWDMSTRYWYSQYIVKNLVNNNFEVRSACSFLCWTIYGGPSVQNVIIALTLWVYIHLESDYTYLYADVMSGPWNFGFAIMRMLCLFYLTPCFVIEETEIALRYYNSIYWMFHIVLAFLAFLAIGINGYRKRAGQTDSKSDPLKRMINDLRRTSNLSLAQAHSKTVESGEKSNTGKDVAEPAVSAEIKEGEKKEEPTTSSRNPSDKTKKD